MTTVHLSFDDECMIPGTSYWVSEVWLEIRSWEDHDYDIVASTIDSENLEETAPRRSEIEQAIWETLFTRQYQEKVYNILLAIYREEEEQERQRQEELFHPYN